MEKKIYAIIASLAFLLSSAFPLCAGACSECGMYAHEMTKSDICVTPAKKTLRIGRSFFISIQAEEGSPYEDLPDEDWDELTEENIEEITYKSSKPHIASVDTGTGKVKGLRKGTAVITSLIRFSDGTAASFKTKIHVC